MRAVRPTCPAVLIAVPVGLLLGMLPALALSCSAGAGGGAGGSDAAGGSNTGGTNLVLDGGEGGFDPDAACAFYEHQAVSKPVNLYIMFDKSSSMAGNKWSAAQAGLTAFVEDEKSDGLEVALNFFPRDPDATPACDQAAYKEPIVPFTELPAGAAAIVAAVEDEQPDGFSTPMYPALGGAILKGIEVAQSSPGEVSAVLLVTDGAPQGPAPTCGGVDPEDPQVIADLAAAGLAYSPSVTTYVVGLPGVDQSTANLIAQAGGSEEAILVGATNVEAEFRDALAKVRLSAVPCSYEIPEQVLLGEVALDRVNVEITPEGGDAEIVPFDPDCAGEGWRYDQPVAPTAIELCPATCQRLKSSPGIAIRVILGCSTQLK